MTIWTLEDLCILNLLGTEYLSQSLGTTDDRLGITDVSPRRSHLINEDLIAKIQPILRDFQSLMESQFSFIEIVQKKPDFALFFIKKKEKN